jgi:hypothetical protein
MRIRLLSFLLAVAWCVSTIQAHPAVVVHEADDTTINGDLISAHGDAIVVAVKAPKSPATRKTIHLVDISQTVFHDPLPAPRHSAPAPKPTTSPTTRPADTIDWRFKLTTGDHFTAEITRWSDSPLTIKSEDISTKPFQLPIDQILEVWCGPTEAVRKSLALNVVPDTDDVAFVQTDGSITAVKGQAVGISGDALQFRYSGQIRKISVAKLIGITFAPRPQTSSPISAIPNQLVQTFKLDSGDALSGKWIGIIKDAVQLQTTWGQAIDIPLGNVASIDAKSGRLVYLSDLIPAKVEQTPFFSRVIPFRLDTNLDGSPLTLSDGKYTKGIAMHARCILQYKLAGEFSRFRAKVGLEEPAGHEGRTIVRLVGDNKTLYENLDTRGDQPPKDLDIDIAGVNQLALEADFGPSQDTGARVVWANARVLRAKTAN